MARINYEIEKGRLGADPEFKTTKDNTLVARLSIAVNNYYYDKETEEWEQKGITSWINGAAFGYAAECIENMELKKGDQVFVQGNMVQTEWEDDDGEERISWDFFINKLFPIPAVYDDEEEDEEDDRPRKKSGRSSKKGGRSSSRKGSSRGSKSSSRGKKPTKFSTRSKGSKSKGKSSYADKILAQLGK